MTELGAFASLEGVQVTNLVGRFSVGGVGNFLGEKFKIERVEGDWTASHL